MASPGTNAFNLIYPLLPNKPYSSMPSALSIPWNCRRGGLPGLLAGLGLFWSSVPCGLSQCAARQACPAAVGVPWRPSSPGCQGASRHDLFRPEVSLTLRALAWPPWPSCPRQMTEH